MIHSPNFGPVLLDELYLEFSKKMPAVTVESFAPIHELMEIKIRSDGDLVAVVKVWASIYRKAYVYFNGFKTVYFSRRGWLDLTDFAAGLAKDASREFKKAQEKAKALGVENDLETDIYWLDDFHDGGGWVEHDTSRFDG